MYYKMTIRTFEIWTYIFLDRLILQGLCFLGCVVFFLCIIGFTCLLFCVRVLFGCRLDFFESMPANVLVKVYVTFSVFDCFLFWLEVFSLFRWFRNEIAEFIGKREFVGYMIRMDLCILRRQMSIIFVGGFASCIFYLPRTLEAESFIHVLLVSLFSSILLLFFFFFDFLYDFLV